MYIRIQENILDYIAVSASPIWPSEPVGPFTRNSVSPLCQWTPQKHALSHPVSIKAIRGRAKLSQQSQRSATRFVKWCKIIHCKKDIKVLGWVHTCNVTAYRNTVSWQCGRDSCPRNVTKVGYAVTLRACSVCCRYLAVASKGWYGYGRSRCGRARNGVTIRGTQPYERNIVINLS
jgi:hypothetical protein